MTGFTPFFLMFGREPVTPVDIVYALDPPRYASAEAAVKAQEGILELAWHEAAENTRAAQSDMIRRSEKNLSTHQEFQVGELVWVMDESHIKGTRDKLGHPWRGPYRIKDKLGDKNYRLLVPEGERMHDILNVVRLKPYFSAVSVDQDHYAEELSNLPTGDDLVDGQLPGAEATGDAAAEEGSVAPAPGVPVVDDLWEVEDLVDARKAAGVWQYRVRWKGCTEDEDTWEVHRNLADRLHGRAAALRKAKGAKR